jgi:hypothetical protein
MWPKQIDGSAVPAEVGRTEANKIPSGLFGMIVRPPGPRLRTLSRAPARRPPSVGSLQNSRCCTTDRSQPPGHGSRHHLEWISAPSNSRLSVPSACRTQLPGMSGGHGRRGRTAERTNPQPRRQTRPRDRLDGVQAGWSEVGPATPVGSAGIVDRSPQGDGVCSPGWCAVLSEE